MSDLRPPDRRRSRLILIIVASALLVAAAVAGIAGLIAGPPTPAVTSPGPTTPPGPTESGTSDGDAVLHLPVTADPVRYATAVAEALFVWDTGDGLPPETYVAALHEASAAQGPEANGLYHDLGNYLPDQDAWAQLAGMKARQWLQVDAAAIPTGWAQASGNLSEQAVAVTIDGTRHREGVWAGKPTQSASPVAFTLFLSCPPGGSCSLLRLTLPNAPLR